jgi:hypothetical protein
MACNLTTGRTLACRDSVGGIKTIYVTELDNKETLTSATEGLISAFTLAEGKQFWEVALIKETSFFTDVYTGSTENGTLFSDQALTVIFNKGDVATRNFVKLLAQNRLMVIVLDRNGVYWLLGETNGLDLVTGSFGSGTAMADRNGYELSFVGKEPASAQSVTSGLIASLIIPGV